MILFIWDSIHKPHVDNDIRVKNSFKFKEIDMVLRLFRDVVISKILKMDVLRYILLIKFIGRVLKNIIVPKIVIKVLIFFVILVIIALNIDLCSLFISMMFLGLIRSIKIILDKMFNIIRIMANLVLKMIFR